MQTMKIEINRQRPRRKEKKRLKITNITSIKEGLDCRGKTGGGKVIQKHMQ